MKITKILSITILMLLATVSNAQGFTLEDVGRNSLKNAGTIMEDNIIKGYFYYYFTERISRKQSNYQIVILDENLNETASKTIEESNRTSMLEASYNGSSVLFKFFDQKLKKVYYRTMDKNGNISDKVERDANKYETAVYASNLSKELKNANVNSVSEEYFVDLYTFKNKGYTYKMECLDNTGGLVWTYTADDAKGVNTGAYLASSKDQILVLEANSKNIMSRNYVFKLVSVNIDGEKGWEMDLNTSRYNMLPHNAFIAEDGVITILGEYYNVSDKSMKSASQGIFVRKLDRNGKKLSDNFISWSRDIGSELTSKEKKELSSYSIYFHNVEMTKSGDIIAIGEQYKKQVSAGGIALKMLGNVSGVISTSASSFEIKIGDMFIITLDQNAELKDVNIIEKLPRRVNAGEGYGLVSQHLLAKLMDAEGYFDYSFTQTTADRSLISIGYTEKEREKGKVFATTTFNVVSFTDGDSEPSKDKIEFETDASDMRINPAKPGYLLISEYYRKEKTIELRLEPINF